MKNNFRLTKQTEFVGVCYRQPNLDEEADEEFYRQLADISWSLVFVLVRGFNLPDACWHLNTAESKQSKRFLECMEDNFLTQLLRELTRGSAQLDLLFMIRKGLVGDVVVRDQLGHSDQEIIVFDSWCCKEGSQQNLYLGVLEGTLWPVQENPLGNCTL